MGNILDIAYGILLAGFLRGLLLLGVFSALFVVMLLVCGLLDWRYGQARRRARR